MGTDTEKGLAAVAVSRNAPGGSLALHSKLVAHPNSMPNIGRSTETWTVAIVPSELLQHGPNHFNPLLINAEIMVQLAHQDLENKLRCRWV